MTENDNVGLLRLRILSLKGKVNRILNQLSLWHCQTPENKVIDCIIPIPKGKGCYGGFIFCLGLKKEFSILLSADDSEDILKPKLTWSFSLAKFYQNPPEMYSLFLPALLEAKILSKKDKYILDAWLSARSLTSAWEEKGADVDRSIRRQEDVVNDIARYFREYPILDIGVSQRKKGRRNEIPR